MMNLETLNGKTLGKLALAVLFGLGVYSYLQERNASTQANQAPLFSTPRAGQVQNPQGGWGNVPHSSAQQPVGGPNTIAPMYRNGGVNGGQGGYGSSAPDSGSGYVPVYAPDGNDGSAPTNYTDPSSYSAPAQNSSSSEAGNFDPAAGVAPTLYSKFNDPAYIQGQQEQHIQEGDLLSGTTTYKDGEGNYVQTDGSNGAAYQDPNSGKVQTFDSNTGAPEGGSSYTQDLTPLGGGSSEVAPAPVETPPAAVDTSSTPAASE